MGKKALFIFLAIIVIFVIANLKKEEPIKGPSQDEWREIRGKDTAEVSSQWQAPKLASVSSGGWEDGAYISADGKNLYFAYINIDLFKLPRVEKIGPNRDSKKICRPACGQYPRIDAFFSQKDNLGNWGEAKPHPLTISYPVGGLVLADQNKAYFHMEKDDGLKTEIYSAEKISGKWQTPQKITALSSKYKDDDPYVNPADSELLFWSDRPGLGGNDIWMSKKVDGRWQEPVLLSAPINTSSNDMQPFMLGSALYFTSDRSGKPKIYKSERIGENQWSNPEAAVESQNGVGEPTLTADGKFLYFVQLFKSDKGEYNSDIFYAERK